jgi:6-phosphogluconolactonase (cycloisomerase 2 family)
MLVYIGSQPGEADTRDGGGKGGEAVAIPFFRADVDGGLRPLDGPIDATATVVAPSFLVAHPRLPVVYAASTVDGGEVVALAVAPGGWLRERSRQPSGGSQPIHLAVGGDGRHLLCANWGSGEVAVLPVGADGALATPTDVVAHGKRYAHHVSLIGAEVTVVHLGANALYGYHLEPPGRLRRAWVAPARPAAGPRHLAMHPSGRRYVADELSSTLSTYVPDPATGGLRLVHSRRATLVDPVGANHLSEIAVSPDGRFVYVASRGNDTISTFAVGGEVPVPVDEVPTGGAFPRHFALAGPWVYVANERSNTVTALRLDDGVPRPTGIAAETPAPTCVLPRA